MSARGRGGAPIFIAWPVKTDKNTSHSGVNIPGGKYIDITRNTDSPDFWHLSPDISGRHIVSDASKTDEKTKDRLIRVAIGTFSPGDNPEVKIQYIVNTKTSGIQRAGGHPHPFFSPDNRMAFFNSDVDGPPQIFMVTGYKFPEF